jgi:probable F420-dependent oxidoreductase
MDIGRIGVWSAELRFGDPEKSRIAAAELDRLGFGALWVPGGIGGDILASLDRLLDITERTTLASAIINIWKHAPAEIGDWWRGQSPARQGRLLLGLGVSHAPLIGEAYQRPIAAMSGYIGALAAEGVPGARLCVAAFGPKMLALSAARTAGAHPYLVTPEHTVAARAQLGPDALIAPGQAVAFETDPAKAREIARGALSVYLRMPNYIASWRRQGFSDADIETASDRLCDALVAWGEVDALAARVRAHLDAGADHVCVKVVRGAPGGDATDLLDDWRALAAALL